MDNLTFQLECCGTMNDEVESDEEENTNQEELISDSAQANAAQDNSETKEEVLRPLNLSNY